ncbi:MAG: polyprenyl synthetase family protein [Pirellulaceae bacterium]
MKESILATASSANQQSGSAEDQPKSRSARRSTAQLKMVPQTLDHREQLREKCKEVADKLDKSRPLTKDEMEVVARELLDQLGLDDGYLGWTMVNLASEFWRDQVAMVPPSRRLFLLPHCLKHAEGCPADYDQFGLDCKTCGACSIADFRGAAEEMGYRVLVAEGSPIVMKIIVSGYVDAIVGVACLNVLEKAIDKILLAGIPCMAVPLLSNDCRNTAVDEQWVSDMIHVQASEGTQQTRSYVHLMRSAAKMFATDELERLAPRFRGGPRLSEMNGQGVGGLDPVCATEAIAYDFLCRGGKHSRPFITLATYDALTGGRGTTGMGAAHLDSLSDQIKLTAMSIETFHKASLVHDDIQDNDAYRYGEETLHRKYGIPTAINVGDYLIGLGYRLVSREAAVLGPDVASDIIDILAEAHTKLSEGQGAELLWRDSLNKRLSPLDALKIYALKTSPAFEAAMMSGVRLAHAIGEYREPVKVFARNLGVAFQILNDLIDWHGDDFNKMSAGGDTLGGRPTVLLALALERLESDEQEELLSLVENEQLSAQQRLARVKELYTKADVFETAYRLVDKHQQRAELVADEIQPEDLRRLMYFLVDTVLERPSTDEAATEPVQIDQDA